MTESTDKQPAPESAQDQPAAPATEPAAEPPQRPGRALAGLAFVLALAALMLAAAGGYYLWDRLQALQTDQQALATTAALQERAEQLSRIDSELRDHIQALSQSIDANQQVLDQIPQRLNELAGDQETLQQRLGRLDVQTRARQGEWIRAEAAYLAKLAIARTRLRRDVDGALAALRLADQLLTRLNSRAIAERQAVNRAINRLVAVDVPEAAELAGRLDGLIAKIDSLPLGLQPSRAASHRQQPPEEPLAGGWQQRLQRAWERLKDTLGELVVVQRGQPVEPLTAPEERYFLYHNLRLRLEAARLALIEGSETIYQRSLSRAAEWLERYYARGEPAVAAALAEIAELRAVDIRPAYGGG